MRQLYRLIWLMLLGLSITLVSCGSSTAEPAYSVIREPELQPGDSIPEPQGEVILTLTGKIKRTNQGDELVFDMELLESLGVIEYTVQNPSPEREQADTHQGVLLENLFALAEIDADATKAHAIAWDDYTVDIPISVTQWPVMITTRRNGERISFHDLGPLQVIFPYHRFDIEPVIYDPMWIHQVHTLEIQ